MNCRFLLLFIIILYGIQSRAQIKINFHNSWGINFVNLEDATGTPGFNNNLPTDSRQLVDWGRFYYNGEVQVLKEVSETLDLGIGVGFNRLYYWEERFRNLFDTQFQFDFGAIWTFEVSGIVNINMDGWLLHSSFGLHSFTDGSGSTVGLAIGGGRSISISDRLTIPIILKTDFVFGDGITIAPNLGVGVMLSL